MPDVSFARLAVGGSFRACSFTCQSVLLHCQRSACTHAHAHMARAVHAPHPSCLRRPRRRRTAPPLRTLRRSRPPSGSGSLSGCCSSTSSRGRWRRAACSAASARAPSALRPPSRCMRAVLCCVREGGERGGGGAWTPLQGRVAQPPHAGHSWLACAAAAHPLSCAPGRVPRAPLATRARRRWPGASRGASTRPAARRRGATAC
jgi:hypothetical protein